MHRPWDLRRAARCDIRLRGHRPRERRAKPGGVFPQLLRRTKTQSSARVTAVVLALRLGRWGIVGFSIAAFVLTFVQTTGFYQIAGSTPGARAAFGASMATLAAQFVALFPPPIRPATVGRYVEFCGFPPLPSPV